MKIIEAMKKIKDLQRKAEDLRRKIAQYHVDFDYETPTYGTPEQQREQVASWLQAHSDITQEICALRYKIQKTNVSTPVAVEVGGKGVTKTIAEWIHRRRDLASLEKQAWDCLTDKNIAPGGQFKKSSGEVITTQIRRYYDPKLRDQKREMLASEPLLIDGALEIANAVTDLI